jgi:putative aminopeptidase FrvX
MELQELTIKLCSASGPSGFEGGVRELIKAYLEPLSDEMYTDALGNLIAVKKCGKPGARRLMLDAHMDEVGFIITGQENGFLRFSTLGKIDPRVLPAKEIRILSPEPVFGVIDTMPPHILSHEEMDRVIEADKLFIDVGMENEEAEKRIPPGTSAVFAGVCSRLGKTCISGKALDDRACVAIVIATMEALRDRELSADIYCLVSVQEELGLRGAETGAYSVRPDMAIVLDATHAHTPDSKRWEALDMGGGAAIGVGPNMNRALTEALINTAKENGIPYQTEVLSGNSGTDCHAIQVSREGVATGLISLPVKYMHSPAEVADMRDSESIVSLLTEFITKIGEDGI